MLVLSRKAGQAVVVAGPGPAPDVPGAEVLRVTVLEAGADGRVVLGFQADPAVPIHRVEVWDRLLAAAGGAGRQ